MKNNFPVLQSPGKLKVTISKKLRSKIKQLCSAVNKIEWSGTIFYIVEGSLTDVDTCEITVDDIYLQDIGSAAYTTFKNGLDVVEYMTENNLLDHYKGLMHSHHNMDAYFSAEDEDELSENAPQNNAYLSIIVNNFGKIVGRVAMLTEQKVEKSYTEDYLDFDGTPLQLTYNLEDNKKVVFYYECDFGDTDFEEDIELSRRIEEVRKYKQQATAVPRSVTASMLAVFVSLDLDYKGLAHPKMKELEKLLGLNDGAKQLSLEIDMETHFDNMLDMYKLKTARSLDVEIRNALTVYTGEFPKACKFVQEVLENIMVGIQ